MAEILNTDITSGKVDGDGVFDLLQKTVNANLAQEYQKGRLNGKDYASVYLGGMQSAIQNAISFLLANQEADKQAEKTIKETLLVTEKITTEGLVQDKLSAEIDLLVKQLEKIDHEIAKAEVEIWVTKAQVSDDMTIIAAPTVLTEGVLGRVVAKSEAEVGLLNQKKTTEEAQTQSGIADSESVIGKEILLRDRQADGFLRDAEQKLAKIVADAFAVQFTTLDGPGEGTVPGSFTTGGIDSIISKAKDGVFNP